MSRPALRNFALLKEDWYDDEVLYAIAEDTTPMVFAYVPMLIGRCREQSHPEDNPLGWVGLTIRKAAALLLDEPSRGQDEDDWIAQRAAMWDALVDGEIAAMEGPSTGRFKVRLVQFAKYQTPKGGTTDRTRAHKLRAGTLSPTGTVGEHVGNAPEQTGTHSDSDRDRESPSPTPLSDAGFAHTSAPAHEAPPTSLGTSSSMIELIVSNLVAASAGQPNVMRECWQGHIDELLVRRPDLSLQALAEAAANMKARVVGGGDPFAFDYGVRFLANGIRRVSVDEAKYAAPMPPAQQPAESYADVLARIEAARLADIGGVA